MTMTIRQQIAPDDFLRRLIKNMTEMPQRIKDSKEAIAAAEYELAVDNTVERAKEHVKDLEAEAAYIVAGETNGTGNKLFADKDKRDAEILRRLNADSEYQDVVKTVNDPNCSELVCGGVEKIINAIVKRINKEVESETDGDGKKLYANDAQRENAVRARLSKDAEYIQTKNELLAAERHEAQLKMHLGKLNIQMKYLIDVSYSNKFIAEMIAGLSHESDIAPRIDAICKKEAILSNPYNGVTKP